MDSEKSQISNRKYSVYLLLLLLLLTISAGVYAHGHRHYRDFESYQHERGGGEASGQAAAWLFVIANVPIAVSLLLKAGRKLPSAGSSYRAMLEKVNRHQKRYFMKLHYWVNPVAAGVAIHHLTETECKSTIMPELGLGLMIFIIVLGLMMTFKLSPSFMKKAVFKLHTSPISSAVALLVLMIGHFLIE